MHVQVIFVCLACWLFLLVSDINGAECSFQHCVTAKRAVSGFEKHIERFHLKIPSKRLEEMRLMKYLGLLRGSDLPARIRHGTEFPSECLELTLADLETIC
ncbi:unnamed protein product [Rotaria sordida]|uniref:Uncharacterized protein n=1 Tax=Rotaria sordida TaxID=392033 RepID=A0A815G384_9BILA|nr:unnamed protein product [Rotaria sordida]CAF1592942.1 unnamed protein product [Rotaria sordida]